MATSKKLDPTPVKTAKPRARRVSSAEREKHIIAGAISFFAKRGFSANTRELAESLGIAHSLLFKYFPSKDALIDRVYQELFEKGWKPMWDIGIRNRAIPLKERLIHVYADYCDTINKYEWVRVYLLAGLDGMKMNERYWGFVRDNIFRHVIDELRFEHNKPSITVVEPMEAEIELIWSLHAALFYLGVRKWVYRLETPDDKLTTITQLVEGFLDAAPRVIAKLEVSAETAKATKTDRRQKPPIEA